MWEVFKEPNDSEKIFKKIYQEQEACYRRAYSNEMLELNRLLLSLIRDYSEKSVGTEPVNTNIHKNLSGKASVFLFLWSETRMLFYEGKYFQFLLSFQNSITLRINVAVSQALCRASAEGKDGCTGFLPGRWSTDLPFLKCIPTQKVTLCS